jgi:hypothetical protein
MTQRAIRVRFGDCVADIVRGCSDTDEIPKSPWRERKEAYIQHLAEAPPETLLVGSRSVRRRDVAGELTLTQLPNGF